MSSDLPTGAAPEPVVSLVLPTFNERDNIEPLIRRLTAALQGVEHEILVVDDRSPDGTAEHARSLAGELPHVRVIERPPPPGLTDSIRDGVQAARGRFVSWMDCDLSHPPELVAALFAPLVNGSADVTLASRYAPGGADIRDSRFERLYSRVINTLSRWVVHASVRDYTTGYVMAPRSTVLAIGLRGDYGEYCIDLLGRAAIAGLRIQEIPYEMASRIAGESKTVPSLGKFFARGMRYLVTVGRLLWLRLRGGYRLETEA